LSNLSAAPVGRAFVEPVVESSRSKVVVPDPVVTG